MSLDRVHVLAFLALALVLPTARAGEAEGELVCCRKRAVCGYNPCCDPCRVGPIRRFFRGCWRPCCPTPCAAPARVIVPIGPPPSATVWVPPAGPVAPSAVIGQPAPQPPFPPSVPPPAPFPGTGSSLRREGILTPPVAPPPIRADRIASIGNSPNYSARARANVSTPVRLVLAGNVNVERLAHADENGRFQVQLVPGRWMVFSEGDTRDNYHGAIDVTRTGVVTVRLR